MPVKEKAPDAGPILFVEEGGQLRLLEKSVEQLKDERRDPPQRADAERATDVPPRSNVRVR
jgi:hypothetical protein